MSKRIINVETTGGRTKPKKTPLEVRKEYKKGGHDEKSGLILLGQVETMKEGEMGCGKTPFRLEKERQRRGAR